jgi:hypothetical protein
VQGFFLSKPLNASCIEELLTQETRPAMLTGEVSKDWSILDSPALGLI